MRRSLPALCRNVPHSCGMKLHGPASADRRSFARSDLSLMIVAFRDWLVQGWLDDLQPNVWQAWQGHQLLP
jgi:hypothetical protein